MSLTEIPCIFLAIVDICITFQYAALYKLGCTAEDNLITLWEILSFFLAFPDRSANNADVAVQVTAIALFQPFIMLSYLQWTRVS